MHYHDQEQPEDIDHDVALATAYTLAAVIAPLAADFFKLVSR